MIYFWAFQPLFDSSAVTRRQESAGEDTQDMGAGQTQPTLWHTGTCSTSDLNCCPVAQAELPALTVSLFEIFHFSPHLFFFHDFLSLANNFKVLCHFLLIFFLIFLT